MDKKKTKKKRNDDLNQFTVPRRATWFILRTLLVITIVVTLAFVVFMESMNVANLYILVTEGLKLRADCVFGEKDPNELYQYFSDEFVKSDEKLTDNIYGYYTISNYDYRLNIDGMNIWPWNTTATVTVTERISSISGTPNVDAPTAAVPEWTDAQYKIVCSKENNRWYITKITLVKEAPEEKPRATPNMSLLPSPTPTPTPTPQMASDSANS